MKESEILQLCFGLFVTFLDTEIHQHPSSLQSFDLLQQQCQGRLALGSSVSSSPESQLSQISNGFVQICLSLRYLLMKASVRTHNHLSKLKISIQHENMAIENLKGQIRICQKPATPLVFFFTAKFFLHFPEEEEMF